MASAPSVTAMLKKLAELEFVERTPRGVVLTEPGRRLALEALRHHRLLERYLVETLGLSVAAAHAEADRLEHALEDVEARIDEALDLESDPHGDPIPDADLRIRAKPWQPLSGMREEMCHDPRVPDADEEMLRYLTDIDLMPGAPVELLLAAPCNGAAHRAPARRRACDQPRAGCRNRRRIAARSRRDEPAGSAVTECGRTRASRAHRRAGAGRRLRRGRSARGYLVHAHLRADLVVDGLQRS